MNEILLAIITAIITVFCTILTSTIWRRIKASDNIYKIVYTKTQDNTISFEKSTIGPIYDVLQVHIPSDKSPTKNEIPITKVYFQEFEIRNIGDTCVPETFLRFENKPEALFWDMHESGSGSVDWENRKKALLIEKGAENFPIPYINPYKTTKHVIILKLCSYQPLDNLQIIGSQANIKFVYKKRKLFRRWNNKKNKTTVVNLIVI